MTHYSFPWMADKAVVRVMAALGAPRLGGSGVSGVDARFVGGCVRDALLGRAIGDIDIATPDTPAVVEQRLTAAGLKAVPTGLAYGTVTAVADGRNFEITTLRRDTACDGRHADVEFTTDWREDASRRDFTINAMSLTLDGALFDYFGGQADLTDGRLRFVGDARDRIAEDYLRILRLFRFQARYGRKPIDSDTLQACAELKYGLKKLSAERVRQELAKLLAAPNPVPSLLQMQSCGVLAELLPEPMRMEVVQRLVSLEADLNLAPLWIRRLAALLGENAQAKVLAERLRLTNDEMESLQFILAGTPLLRATMDPAEYDLLLYRQGAEAILNRTLVCAARATENWRLLLHRAITWVQKPMPIGGDVLLRAGVVPGPAIGMGLRAAEERWVASGFAAPADELLALAKAAAARGLK